MGFVVGDRVEVEKRHLGSYRSATVLGNLDYSSPPSYLVRYANSMTDVVPAADVRRSPPCVPATRFATNDRVDALDGGVWRSGTVTRRNGPSDYYVCFDVSGVEIRCNLCNLRVHLDRLDNGYWVSSEIARKLGLT